MGEYRFEENGEMVFLSPVVEIETKLGRLELTYRNTRLRFFSAHFEQMDHVEIRDESGVRGILNDELMKQLSDMNFPHSFDPVPDDATIEWFVALQMADLLDDSESP